MKHFSLEDTLNRIKLYNDNANVDVSPIIANLLPPKPPATPPVAPVAPVTPKDSDDNTKDDDSDDSDGNDDSDDSDDSDDDSDDCDEIETFPSTPVTKPIYDSLQDFSTQAQVVAEIINQVEGFKGKGDKDKTNQAVAALRAALTDMSDMQNKCKDTITKYLTDFKGA